MAISAKRRKRGEERPARRRGAIVALLLLAGIAAMALAVVRALWGGNARAARPDAAATSPAAPLQPLLQTLYRNGIVHLEAPRVVSEAIAALSGGAITPPDAPETPIGRTFRLDPQTAVLVSSGDADDALAASAAMGWSLRCIHLPVDGLGALLIPNSIQPEDPGDASGLYVRQEGTNSLRLVAWASDAWVRRSLARAGEPTADDYARLATIAPNSILLLRHMLGRAEGRASEVLLTRIRLLSTPAIGAPATFGDRVEWRGARLLNDADAAATNGLLRIRHYWHIPANASRIFGRLAASTRFRRRDAEVADDFPLGPGTSAVTADDPERDSLDFVTDRDVPLGDTPSGATWSMEVGVVDPARGGAALRAASDLLKATERRVRVDDPIPSPGRTATTDPASPASPP